MGTSLKSGGSHPILLWSRVFVSSVPGSGVPDFSAAPDRVLIPGVPELSAAPGLPTNDCVHLRPAARNAMSRKTVMPARQVQRLVRRSVFQAARDRVLYKFYERVGDDNTIATRSQNYNWTFPTCVDVAGVNVERAVSSVAAESDILMRNESPRYTAYYCRDINHMLPKWWFWIGASARSKTRDFKRRRQPSRAKVL